MSISDKKLIIVVPLFDEEESLPRLNVELNKFLERSPVTTGVLLVNDGSRDRSQILIEKICRDDNRYHFLQLHKNSGLSTALKAGFDYCESELIGYIDADLQTIPLDFLDLLKFIPEYDLVTGIRCERKDGTIKKISSKVANHIRRLLIHDGIEDTGCPLKIGKAAYLKAIPFFHGMHRFIPALVQMAGGKVKQLPVKHYRRLEGKPKYHLGNRIVGPLFDTFAFRWMQNNYIRYEIDKHSLME
jgi:dolichol-phosphate mannosyltransferase